MEKTNHQALCFLDSQDWNSAQLLFRENANKHTSYQAYNNYGYYLVTQGMSCNNGKTKNAIKLGAKYIARALDIKRTVTSISAMVTALEYQCRDANSVEKNELYKKASTLIQEGLKIQYSDEMQYNFLRYQYLLNTNDQNIFKQIRSLMNSFVTEESILLYLLAVCSRGLKKEANACIARYREYIDDYDLLMVYVKTEQYKKGYSLCKQVFKNYSMNKFVMSAIIECCVNTQHFEEALSYSQKTEYWKRSECCFERIPSKIIINLSSSTKYRRRIIKSYYRIPPYIEQCGYFGCLSHNIPW